MSEANEEEPPEVTVRLRLKIEATYEISGDYMRGSTLPKILAWARDDSRYFRLFLARGQAEHKEIPAKFTVESLTIVPR